MHLHTSNQLLTQNMTDGRPSHQIITTNAEGRWCAYCVADASSWQTFWTNFWTPKRDA